MANIVVRFIKASKCSTVFYFHAFRALKLSTKEKVKQVFTMIKEECSASDNRSSKIKYILDLLTAYFDEEIEHILRVFEVKCIIKYIVLFEG